MPEIQVIPRVRVSRGKAFSREEDRGASRREDAQEVVRRALQEKGTVIIADMDGIRRNRPDMGLLKTFEGEAVWAEGGCRTSEGVIDLLVAGAEAVIMGTATLRDMEELRRAHQMSENILFQLDFSGDLLAPLRGPRRPRAANLRDEAASLDLRGIIIMDAEGWRQQRDLLRRGGVPLYVGLGTQRDAWELEGLGVKGVIVPWEGGPDG